jgi:hypothetical protein
MIKETLEITKRITCHMRSYMRAGTVGSHVVDGRENGAEA